MIREVTFLNLDRKCLLSKLRSSNIKKHNNKTHLMIFIIVDHLEVWLLDQLINNNLSYLYKSTFKSEMNLLSEPNIHIIINMTHLLKYK